MSTFRTVSRGAAGLIKQTGTAAAGAISVGGTIAKSGVSVAATVINATAPKVKAEEEVKSSLAVRGAVKSIRLASGAARVAAKGVGVAAETSMRVAGRALAGAVPASVTANEYVAGVVEVTSAALEASVVVMESAAEETHGIAKATTTAAGSVAAHRYGSQAGQLVEEALGVAVDATEIGREVARTKFKYVIPTIAKHAVDRRIEMFHMERDGAVTVTAVGTATDANGQEVVVSTTAAAVPNKTIPSGDAPQAGVAVATVVTTSTGGGNSEMETTSFVTGASTLTCDAAAAIESASAAVADVASHTASVATAAVAQLIASEAASVQNAADQQLVCNGVAPPAPSSSGGGTLPQQDAAAASTTTGKSSTATTVPTKSKSWFSW